MARLEKHRKSLYIFGVLALLALLLQFLSNFPAFIESYYSKGCYPYWASLLRMLLGWIPIALGDLLYVATILFMLWWLIKSVVVIAKTSEKFSLFTHKLLLAGQFFFCLFILFKLSWGLNYDRLPVYKSFQLEQALYNEEELEKLAVLLIEKLRTIDSAEILKLRTKDHAHLTERARSDYQQFAKKYGDFHYNVTSVKPMLSSKLISKFAVEGYFNPFTGETNVNREMPAVSLSFTYAHEIAHQMGIAKEDEANLLAYLSGINSTDAATRYAAYYGALSYILFELYRANPGKFNTLYETSPNLFKQDMKTEQAFWQAHRSVLSGYMNTVLDAYLKFNNQASGVKSYREVVVWIYNYHKAEMAP